MITFKASKAERVRERGLLRLVGMLLSLKGHSTFRIRYDCDSHHHIARMYESQYCVAARGTGMPTAMIFDAVK